MVGHHAVGSEYRMSKSIVIQEGGIGKQLTVDKLKTDLVGGGTCLWVPEDEMNLGTKSVSENGTYVASDDGYYGYSQFTVSGVGTAIGKAPDGSGDEAEATVDPVTGDIKITKLPSSIDVIEPPTNPYGIYVDGQTITKDGMVVKGYLQSGGEWGVVSNGEITLNPTTAVYDESKDEKGASKATSDLETALSQPIPFHSGGLSFTGPDGLVGTIEAFNGAKYVLIKFPSRLCAWVVGDNNNAYIECTSKWLYEGRERTDTRTYRVGLSYNHDGKTAYYNGTAYDSLVSFYRTPYLNGDISLDSSFYGDGPSAWTILYGEIEEGKHGSRQTIAVTWPRPGDGKVLETTFEILVAPGYGGDEGENGNAGTPPPGMLIP